jgi:hypothetical protein
MRRRGVPVQSLSRYSGAGHRVDLAPLVQVPVIGASNELQILLNPTNPTVLAIGCVWIPSWPRAIFAARGRKKIDPNRHQAIARVLPQPFPYPKGLAAWQLQLLLQRHKKVASDRRLNVLQKLTEIQ